MSIENTGFQPSQRQRDSDVLTFGQFDGLRNDVDPERFDLGDMVMATNVDIDQTGRISRRGGYTQRAASVNTHSLWSPPQGDICLFVSGGQLKQLQPDMSATVLGALLDGSSPVSYERVDDRVYFANGTDTGIVENGTIRTWGLPQAPLPGAVPTIGTMPAGTYQFNMIWLRADGQGSGCGQNGVLELPEGSGIDFMIPAAPSAEIVGAVVYLSPANSDVLLEAGVAGPSQVFMWRADPSALSVPLVSQFRGPPPAGHMVAYYRGHMFVAVGDTIYVSAPYAYEQFDRRRYIQLDSRITLMASISDLDRTEAGRTSGFFIATERSTGVLSGNNPDEFQYIQKADYGAVAGTMQMIEGTRFKDGANGTRLMPMWLSQKGVCIGLPELAVLNLTRGRYNFVAGGRGAALFLPDPARFIATHSL